MDWKKWIKAAGIRAIKTAAQTAIAMLPTTAFALGEVNWILTISTAAGAAVLSLITSLAGIPECDDGISPLTYEGE